MNFNKLESKIPLDIESTRILIINTEEGGILYRADFIVLNSDGSKRNVNVDLEPHLNAGQLNALSAILNGIISKAKLELF